MRQEKTYKGVTIFGAPGSGKTTIARLLLGVFTASYYIEASHAVINPTIAHKKLLPNNEQVYYNHG